jgi:hypothetical protein
MRTPVFNQAEQAVVDNGLLDKDRRRKVNTLHRELMAWYREGIEAEKQKRRLAEVEAELAKTKITPEQPDQELEPEQDEPPISW